MHLAHHHQVHLSAHNTTYYHLRHQATQIAKEHQKEEEEKAKATGKPASSTPGFDAAPVGEIPARA